MTQGRPVPYAVKSKPARRMATLKLLPSLKRETAMADRLGRLLRKSAAVQT